MGPLGGPGDSAEPARSTAGVAADAPATADAPPLLEVLDRDGHVRQTFAVHRWPLRIGRALANDVVLGDPHVAARHLSIAPGPGGLALTVGETGNGVAIGRRRLKAGHVETLDPDADAVEFGAGRTRLRLRLRDAGLAAEEPLAPATSLARRAATPAFAALVLAAGLLLRAYLQTDPDRLAPAAGATLLTALTGAAVWCGAWALLSKTFTRQARFGWHLRVFLVASVALLALDLIPALLAFALSWPWLTDFAFVAEIGVASTALYFHLLAVEPARPRMLKWLAAGSFGAGVALSLWLNVQRTDLFGEELYMSHLFPPRLRLATPVPVGAFVDALAPLKPVLDRKARESGHGGDADGSDDDE